MNSEGTHELDKHTEYITIPIGAESGEVIILSNRGNEGASECRGDVKVTLNVEEHATFKRNGLDIIMEKKITLKEALCGFVFEIEHLNGKKFSIDVIVKFVVLLNLYPQFQMLLFHLYHLMFFLPFFVNQEL